MKAQARRPLSKLAGMELVTNSLPVERILESIKEFVSDERHDLDSIRIPLIFEPEKYKDAKVDLSEGVHLEVATIRKSMYQTALGIVRLKCAF